MTEPLLLRTGISPVFTKLPHHSDEWRLVPVKRPNPHGAGEKSDSGLCWFDEMLGSEHPLNAPGIYVPGGTDEDSNRPFLIIVSGPPGTAKSTFALQVCVNYARAIVASGRDRKPAALYITTETTAKHIVEKAENFGWTRGIAFTGVSTLDGPLPVSATGKAAVAPANTIYIHSTGSPEHVVNESGGATDSGTLNGLNNFHGRPANAGVEDPDILVIDSFNTLPEVRQEDGRLVAGAIQQLTRFCVGPHKGRSPMRPRVVIVVLDVDSAQDDVTRAFSFFADATIRFGMSVDKHGVAHRTVEIVKMKLQKHAEGTHAIEILKRPTNCDEAGNGVGNHHGNTPFVAEGGVFVYPSVPWFLEQLKSFYKPREHTSPPSSLPVWPESFGELLVPSASPNKGFTPGQTVALVGKHATLKSRVAYGSLLKHVFSGTDKSGLIVSRTPLFAISWPGS